MLVRGKFDLKGFLSGVDLLGPNPDDAGGLSARKAWPFLIALHQRDQLDGSLQVPSFVLVQSVS
jgi:hypothetical protein